MSTSAYVRERDDLIREFYSIGGAKAVLERMCQLAMPPVTPQCIAMRASKLGVPATRARYESRDGRVDSDVRAALAARDAGDHSKLDAILGRAHARETQLRWAKCGGEE